MNLYFRNQQTAGNCVPKIVFKIFFKLFQPDTLYCTDTQCMCYVIAHNAVILEFVLCSYSSLIGSLMNGVSYNALGNEKVPRR